MIELRNLSKTIDGKEVLKDISLTIGKGEIFEYARAKRIRENNSAPAHSADSLCRIKGRFYLIRWK